MMKKLLAGFTFLLISSMPVIAQDDPEYRMEIGGGVGLMTYEGDFNGSILSASNTAPTASIILRRVVNPYMAFRFDLGYGKIKGSSKDAQTFYPDYNTGIYSESAREDYAFSNTMIDLNAIYEYNFWPYGTGRDYRGAKRLTPYILIGLGFNYAHCADGWTDLANSSAYEDAATSTFGTPQNKGGKSVFTANMPLGIGVKYKVGERINLGLEWIFHFTLSDKLDGVKDPYRVSSSGIFKNTDCYSNIKVSLTYSFWEKCKTCMKDF